MRYLVVLLLFLSGCAAQHAVTLYPRGAQVAQGIGVLGRVGNDLVINLDGQKFAGKWQLITSQASGLGPRTVGNNCSALLLSDGRQLRCDFTFDQMWTGATGVCVDYRNITYDMLVK